MNICVQFQAFLKKKFRLQYRYKNWTLVSVAHYERHNSFWAKLSNSGNSDVQHTVALGNVHEIAHEENLQEENLEKQLGNALGTRTRIRGNQ